MYGERIAAEPVPTPLGHLADTGFYGSELIFDEDLCENCGHCLTLYNTEKILDALTKNLNGT